MNSRAGSAARGLKLSLLWLALALAPAHSETFRVATYNLGNYLDAPLPLRPAKTPESKAKIRESIHALKPHVLALQEMGSLSALQELRDSLKSEGLEFPYWEYVAGYDTNIHVAILSRFPFTARRSHTNESFLLSGRRFHVSRGFGEVEIQVNPHYSFTLITAHLKSKRAFGAANEAELRLEEAKLLREKIDARLAAQPEINLVVLGDFNDSKDSASTRMLVGRGKRKLLDTRPAELDAESALTSGQGPKSPKIAWTHFYPAEDSYSRIDYLLLSPGMAREWIPKETYVLRMPDWGVASDHRPLVATFEAEDK